MPDAPSLMPSVEVRDLVKSYGRTRAVDGLSMTVTPGSIYGFVGPNGAGKTTTMRVLATLLAPEGGTAAVAGSDVVAHAARVRGVIGYMPDFFGTYDNLTVSEYLDFYAASYGVAPARRRQVVGELLELVDLSAKSAAMVEGLSRGMKQRLGLARCLVHDPQVLLLDEPASGMDPRARVEMREIVKELQRMGKTILISSHILMELSEMCTHIGIVNAGRIVMEGPVSTVLRSLTRGRTVRIQLLAGAASTAAVEAARSYPAVSEAAMVEAPDGVTPPGPTATLEVVVEGDDAEVAGLLRSLVEGGLQVLSFAPVANNLEEVFMRVTSG